jgi:hypothetical protein
MAVGHGIILTKMRSTTSTLSGNTLKALIRMVILSLLRVLTTPLPTLTHTQKVKMT